MRPWPLREGAVRPSTHRLGCLMTGGLPDRHFKQQAVLALLVKGQHAGLGRPRSCAGAERGGQVTVDERDDRLKPGRRVLSEDLDEVLALARVELLQCAVE